MLKQKEKLVSRVNELEEYRYKEKKSLEFFLCKEDKVGENGAKVPKLTDEKNVIKVGEVWKGRDLYLWLQKDICIKSEWKEETVVGLFDFGNTGGGNNSGFESLIYIDGKPFQGVDSNHKEVFFDKEFIGKDLEITFRLWSGLEGGGEKKEQEHKIHKAELAILDTVIDDLYYTSKVILETIEILDANDSNRVELLSILNKAFMFIDWTIPGNQKFYKSAYEANKYLQNAIDDIEKHSKINITCIGHTHIDVAWLWRLKHTREKAARSFSTVLRLMERYPDYVFLQTQPQLYEYIKNDYPVIYEGIKKQVAAGKWEVDGAMWVEADCNITSGESLVRQILVGSRFIKKEFNKACEYLWLPDVFGYSWALPQILKKSGIDTFMTTKISWNQYNRIPHDTFNWRGIDGSEILAHFITTPEPWDNNEKSFFATYNGFITPKTVKGIWDRYQEKSVNKDLVLSYGYGDGGGGVNREMLESRRRVDKVPGLPNVKTGTARDYFRKLQDTVKNTEEYVHTWDGELYLEYHRGTYTSQAYNKRANRKLEFLYRRVEWLNVLSSLNKEEFSSYPSEELLKGWKIILTNQFHDIIPGSSITEVYEDSRLDYIEAEAIANKAKDEAVKSIIEVKENTYTIFNDSSWTSTQVVTIENKADLDGCFYDENENKLLSQKYEDGFKVQVTKIPALGWTTITFKEEKVEKEETFSYQDRKLETPHYVIIWNEKGQITSIFDREAKREVVAKGETANKFQMFEDKPLGLEAWDIDIFYQEKHKEVTELKKVELVENGELQAKLRFNWSFNKSTIDQEVIVYKDSKRIDFKTKVDWHEKHILFKVAFPVDIRSNEARYDIQFGNAKRPTHWNTSWDQARFETVGHKWADLSERNYGVALLNDCKYGYDVKDNILRLSLIKSATYPDPEQDQGKHQFTYGLLPHVGDFIEGNVEKEAWNLNMPAVAIEGKVKMENTAVFHLDNSNIEVDAIKKAEEFDGVILRIHEYSGSRQSVNIKSRFNIEAWQECNLMEKLTKGWSSEEISLELTPYEIKTIALKISK